MKILVIEDNESFSVLLRSCLEEAGYETAAAFNGKDGIKAALSVVPDIILLDYHLGDMSGYDVAVGIRCMRATSCIPFILLSSMGDDPLVVQGFRKFRNCRGALCKARPLEELIAAVRAAAVRSD